MYFHVNEKTNQKAPLISDDVYEIILKVWRIDILTFRCYFVFFCGG
jgi:hypothetical protein